MSSSTWRLLITQAADGPMNMAIDHAIMEAVADQHVPPTLRFYAWQPGCLSLGYTQPLREVDRVRLASRGWDLVRRLTGGRAVLHIDELTYSVAVPEHNPIVAGDIVSSYRNLSRALLAGLVQLGAEPRADKQANNSSGPKGPVCFEIPSHYEITIDNKKLVGSAQVRKYGTVLQHGSLPLYGDIARICDTLVFEDDTIRQTARDRVRERAITLEDALQTQPNWDHVAQIMARSFQSVFNLDLIPAQSLTPLEQSRANQLRADQYNNEEWLARF